MAASPVPTGNTLGTLGKSWVLKPRPGTGLFIETREGVHLARVDQGAGTLFFWDKLNKREVAVNIRDLLPAQIGV